MIFTTILALFIFIPIAELAVLLRVGSHLGLAGTLLLVVCTGVVGAWLARLEGLKLVWDIRCDMQAGRMPAPRLIDGLMILTAGILLITPGLITDATGLLLLIPSFRQLLKRAVDKAIRKRINKGVIDVEYREW
jgi:UPF0716 protein FxsA